jgi:hypothetical protein
LGATAPLRTRLACETKHQLVFGEVCYPVVDLRSLGGAVIPALTKGILTREAETKGEVMVRWKEVAADFESSVPIYFLVPASAKSLPIMSRLWNKDGVEVGSDPHAIPCKLLEERKRRREESPDSFDWCVRPKTF